METRDTYERELEQMKYSYDREIEDLRRKLQEKELQFNDKLVDLQHTRKVEEEQRSTEWIIRQEEELKRKYDENAAQWRAKFMDKSNRYTFTYLY
jgi:hypothetical protein